MPSAAKVVGVWVESSKGNKGLADKVTNHPTKPHVAYYTKKLTFTGSAPNVKLKVGCGGTSSKWKSASWSVTSERVTKNWIINHRCDDPPAGDRGSCTGAPFVRVSGDTVRHFFDGWCTDGAERMVKIATGFYVAFNPPGEGDAKQWNEHADEAGFRMSSVPVARSIYVQEFGGDGSGHVAWVSDAWVSGGQVKFRIWEMNRTTRGAWSAREMTLASGMYFIQLPSGAKINDHT